MKILIVEDDDIKRNRISGFLKQAYPSAEIEENASYQSGLGSVLNSKFDMIILDMTMPIFDVSPEEDGGRPQPYAGRKILQQMKRRNINASVIIVTQFDIFGDEKNTKTLFELNKELTQEFQGLYKGSVFYHASQDRWQDELKLLIGRNV